ncbi:GNAT family N-acetyltransferase [Dyella japonica]|uniref:GCN5 family acetyltransferase n=1 Tax=Dyella japonica A8 TaxID=1217721 RepID=A0A075K5B8_9GAMM|nr:N-acetyltransferase [Dyella japonica]AIF48872.1 GCN5 family acetyltransferase [Dyella japonica A8]
MLIRPETPADVAAIHALTAAAFHGAAHSSGTEPFINDGLRRAGQLTLSLVAEDDGVIVGHAAISPVVLSDGSAGWLGLGPVSVLPQRQHEGIGSRIIRQALETLRREGAAGCVVLGDPAYYGRFGFRAHPSMVLPDVPPEYFQILAFDERVPVASVSYHEAFYATGDD